jgi:thioesterase domain-containing protein/acyl carrier protein
MPIAVEVPPPLSLAQERFLLVNRLVGDLPLHNLPVAWRIRGTLDPDVLSRSLAYLADRHPALRTRYSILEDGSAFQDVLPGWRPELEIVPIEGSGDVQEKGVADWKRAVASRPFRLTEEPAFRASLARLGPDDHVLLLVFHHIAFDGWSYGVVVRDLGHAYTAYSRGEEPSQPALPLSYGDYAIVQREWVRSPEADQQRVRWSTILEGAPPELDLRVDRPRSSRPSYRVERFRHVLEADFRSAFDEFAKVQRATPFTILMAAFQTLLGARAGQDGFLIGFPLANRQDRADLSALVGCFINILLLPADLSGDPTFLELIRRVRRAAFEAFPYQKLPFDEVAKIVRPDRSLTQVQFNYRDYAKPVLELGDLRCEDLDYDPGMSAVDLSLDVYAWKRDALVLEIEYALDLFDRSTIEGMVADYERLLRAALATPEKPLSELTPPPATAGGNRVPDPARRERSESTSRGALRIKGTSYVERALIPIWEDALGVTGIGTEDDFFELGGQSLMAVHLVSEVERTLGGSIPLGWILEHPTVARMARAIETRPSEPVKGTEFLIPVRASGSLPPLFCVHGVAGGVFAYREAAELLGPEQPVYGIMLVGKPLARIPRSVEAMADRYIEEIRMVQPVGPYRLAGYSFGCLVAYEMARRLSALGEAVDFVGLIAPPTGPASLGRLRSWARRALRIRVAEPRTIGMICLAAARSYRPLPFAGRVVYFRPENSRWRRSERMWSRLSTSGLDVRVVPGEHLTIMGQENAPVFARELRLALSATAEGDTSAKDSRV